MVLDELDKRLAELVLPELGMPVSQCGKIRSSEAAGVVAIEVTFSIPCAWLKDWLQGEVERLCAALGMRLGNLDIQQRIAAHSVQPNLSPLPNVRNIIAVGSGKGGVGKSTTAVNLAVALAQDGARVGLLDADIYGPSIPIMLGLHGRPDSPDGKSIEPLRAHGVVAMSIGLLVDQDTPMIWRGPMATSALSQLLNDTRWGELDYLVVDLPPGTGDIQLTLAQKIPVAGAVIVTTPQDVATLDARKALRMFEKVEVPVLGLVENMAVHVCSHCGHAEHIFGEGGGRRMAEQYGVALLGSLPLDVAVRELGDSGNPIVTNVEKTATVDAYKSTARRLAIQLSGRPQVARPLSVSLLS